MKKIKIGTMVLALIISISFTLKSNYAFARQTLFCTTAPQAESTDWVPVTSLYDGTYMQQVNLGEGPVAPIDYTKPLSEQGFSKEYIAMRQAFDKFMGDSFLKGIYGPAYESLQFYYPTPADELINTVTKELNNEKETALKTNDYQKLDIINQKLTFLNELKTMTPQKLNVKKDELFDQIQKDSNNKLLQWELDLIARFESIQPK